MDTMGEQYLDSICRTCMHEITEAAATDANPVTEQQWQSVFDTIDECGAKRVAELITNTMPQIKVHLFDELPKKICIECLQLLLSAYRFQQMCTQSDQQMRELIAKRNTDVNAEASVESEINTVFLTHEFNLETTNFESVVSLPEEAPPPPPADVENTSQSNDGEPTMEDCEDSQIDLSEFLKNEPFYDAPTVEYNVDETPQPMASVKNEVLPEEPSAKHVVCGLCDKMLSNEFALLRHMRLRHANRGTNGKNVKLSCGLCSMTFSRQYNLNRHRRRQHANDETANLACNQCDKTFLTTDLLRRHKRHRHANRPKDHYPAECKICDIIFTRRSSLVRHEMRKHNVNFKETITKFPCDLCSKTFSAQFSLTRHKRFMHDEERILKLKEVPTPTCDLCDVTFSRHSSLKRHNRFQHSSENPQKTSVKLPCDQCGKTFFNHFLLGRHKRIRHGIRSQEMICDICGIKFVNRFSLMRHKTRMHCITESSWQKESEQQQQQQESEQQQQQQESEEQQQKESEEEQQQEFEQQQQEFEHQQQQESEEQQQQQESAQQESEQQQPEQYTCEFCHKGFPDSIQLGNHVITHTGERPYLCLQCGTTFIKEHSLNQHLLRHQRMSRTQEHACDICESSFAKIEQLRRHKLYHGERTYKCDYCDLTFVRGDDQRRHLRTHTGEKPYACKYCGRSFSQCNDRIRHMRLHVGEMVYRCNLCPAAFRFATELRLHNNDHINEDEETREQNMRALKEAEDELGINLFQKEFQHTPNTSQDANYTV